MKIYQTISTVVTVIGLALTLAVDARLIAAGAPWQVIPVLILNILTGMTIEGYFSKKLIDTYKDVLKVSKNILAESRADLAKFSTEYQGYKNVCERDIANLEAEVVRLNGIIGAKDIK